MNLLSLLHEKFGFETFREGQLDIIHSVLAKRDAFAVLPTGGGKSICFQLPALIEPGLTIVVSPLISLMNDQVRGLREIGIPAGCLHSGQSMTQKRQVFADLRSSRNYLLYLSPERVQKDGFSEWIKSQRINLFAIDEAHCVSKWGHDFREDYHRLKSLRDIRPDVPILALTATATPQVLADTSARLGLKNPDRHVHGFYRPNLYYQVESCADEDQKFRYVEEALRQNPSGRILIYCGTRKQSEQVSASLKKEFSDISYYHAGLSAEDRTQIQKKYDEGSIRILAATNAFGMGIDHPDVRLVVHFQMPANIESLYQEMGRAGRDQRPSTCLLLYSKKDKGLQSFFIQNSKGSPEDIRHRWRSLDAIVQFAEGGECRHGGILTYFRDANRVKACGHCDTCDPNSDRKVRVRFISAVTSKFLKKMSKMKKVEEDLTPLSREEELRAEILRNWRKNYADKNDIPAFMVFSNRTLRDLAVKVPKNAEELERVYGFGPHKVEHLGDLVLATLASG